QIPGRNPGWPAGEFAISTEHLLDSARRSLVWVDGKSHPVCRADGLAALGDHRHGRWPQADAQDLRPGRAQSGSKRLPTLLVGALAGELAIYRERDEARVGVRMALADSSRNDFSQSRAGPIADDGSRPERHEPGHGGDDPDRHPRLHGGRPDFPHDGAASAGEIWPDAGVEQQVSGLSCQVSAKLGDTKVFLTPET